jgi:hypothetical protein
MLGPIQTLRIIVKRRGKVMLDVQELDPVNRYWRLLIQESAKKL